MSPSNKTHSAHETPLEQAAELLKQALPKPFVDLLDWSTLRRETTPATPHLPGGHDNVVFTVQLLASPEFLIHLLPWPPALTEVEQLLRYICLVTVPLQLEGFLTMIHQHLPEAEESAMTVAAQLRAEGRVDGLAQAQTKARARLLRQMTVKFGALSTEHAAVIEAATEQQLDDFSERLLTEPTSEAVLAPGRRATQ